MGFGKLLGKIAKVAVPASVGYFAGGGSLGAIGSSLGLGGSSATGAAAAAGTATASSALSPWLAPAATLAGGLLTNSANAAQARQQMDFQAQQNATSYQRAVADLKAAGLNPMLAYTNGGASSGSGVAAVMQNAIGGAVTTALDARKNRAEVDNLEATNEQIRSNIALNRSLGVKALADAGASAADADKKRQDIAGGKSQADWNSRHPNLIGFKNTVDALTGGLTGGANSAAAVRNAVRPVPKNIHIHR